MNKTSGNFLGRGQWGESFITLLGHHRLQKFCTFQRMSIKRGEKRKARCWFKFLHIEKCTFISIKSWPIVNQKSPLCLATSEDGHCQQDAEISGPVSPGSDGDFPGGSAVPVQHTGSSASAGAVDCIPHVSQCPSSLPSLQGTVKQTQGMKWLICCCAAGLRCTSNWHQENESGPPGPSPHMAEVGALHWSPPWGCKKGPELSLKETRQRDRSVIFLEDYFQRKRWSSVLNKLLRHK